MLSDLQLVYMVPRNSTQLVKINTTKFQVEREPVDSKKAPPIVNNVAKKNYMEKKEQKDHSYNKTYFLFIFQGGANAKSCPLPLSGRKIIMRKT